ncbi:MAG: ribonuclease P protein component [Gammaproteobacteria bacterium]|nr:ribonuclease P protein component [Gammaproteobacteria bacterium]
MHKRGHLFQADARLRTAADFSRVFDKPVKSADRYFTVLAKPCQEPRTRVGLIIAKKRLRLAVQRNRVKRIIRESFRQRRQSLGNLDAVVLARDKLDKADNHTLFRSLDKHWKRLSRLCGNSSSC